MNTKNLNLEFWTYCENQDTKISIRIIDWLNKDNLNAIIVDNKVFWIELVCSTSTFPNFAYEYIKKWCKKQGLVYLYDLKSPFDNK